MAVTQQASSVLLARRYATLEYRKNGPSGCGVFPVQKEEKWEQAGAKPRENEANYEAEG